MNCFAFETLPLEDQLIAIEDAVCIGRREEAGCRVRLYQLHSFYIETFHCNIYLTIHKVEAFTCMDKLDPYLEQITLEGSL